MLVLFRRQYGRAFVWFGPRGYKSANHFDGLHRNLSFGTSVSLSCVMLVAGTSCAIWKIGTAAMSAAAKVSNAGRGPTSPSIVIVVVILLECIYLFAQRILSICLLFHPHTMSETKPYIQALQRIPKETFLFGPSPIQFLPRLSKELSPNGDVKIWAKRDDCNR